MWARERPKEGEGLGVINRKKAIELLGDWGELHGDKRSPYDT